MKRHRYILATLVAAVTALSFSACESDPKSSQSGHFHAEGIELRDSGIKVFRYFQGVIDSSVSAEIDVDMGLSPLLRLSFLGSDGSNIGTPESDDHTLGWIIGDTDILGVEQHEGEVWDFHLLGKKPGETTIEFRIYHGDHYDFRTIDLPVHVEAPEMPERIRLVDEGSGTELATSVHEGEGSATGSLSVGVGATSGHIKVEFQNATGGTVHPPQGVVFRVHVESSDTSVLTVVEPSEEEPHEFKITGVSAGTASIEIKVKAELGHHDHHHHHHHHRLAKSVRAGHDHHDHHHSGVEVHFEPISVVVE